MKGAFETGVYRNVFLENGYTQEEIDRKIESSFQTMFYGPEEERIYHPVGEDMGYMEDTGNHDARTEGMSYGMMMCVQMDRKEEFDRLWKWTKTYMYMEDGRKRRIFRLVLSAGRNKRIPTALRRTGRIFGDGAVFCIQTLGRRRRHFQLFPGGQGDSSRMYSPGGGRKAASLCGKQKTI